MKESTQSHSVTFKHIRGGQPHPYADSVYEFDMIFTATRGENGWVDVWYPPKDKALRYAHLWQPFAEYPEWHQSRLETFEEYEKGKWHVKIVEPYLG